MTSFEDKGLPVLKVIWQTSEQLARYADTCKQRHERAVPKKTVWFGQHGL